MSRQEKISEDEIDLLALVKLVWSRRSLILKAAGVFLFLGVVFAFTSKVEYKAVCKLMPETQEGSSPNLGRLGGLAGLAGVDLGVGSAGILTPELYPEIVKSAPFLQSLINVPVFFESLDTTMSSFIYLKNVNHPTLIGLVASYTIGLPGKIKGLFSTRKETQKTADSSVGILRFTTEERELLTEYSNRLSVSVDDQTGIIYISAQMPDPVASAEVASNLVSELTERVSAYKLEKVRRNLEFIQERFTEAKKNYDSIQLNLAKYQTKNRNISNSLFQIEFEKLRNELDISFEVYKGLATQLKQAEITVKEETPIFTVLEPVQIPSSKSRPRRLLIIVSSVLAGMVLALFYVLFNQYIYASR